MAFRIKSTARAKRDLNKILAWLLSENAGDAGLQWFQGLRESLDSLSENPRCCTLAPENDHAPFEVRHMLYGNKPHIYPVLFTIDADTVTVLHIRHGRRLPVGNI